MSSDPDQAASLSEKNSLLICTDPIHGKIYQKSLKKATGNCEVHLLDDPLQLMPALSKAAYDLILLDVDKVDLDGSALVRGIRELFSALEMPVLIIHSARTINKRNSALAAGANDWLTKPFEADRHLFRINSYLMLGRFYKANRAILANLENEIRTRTAKLDMLIDSGLMMSVERSRAKLLKHILVEGRRLLNCDGGTMYLVTPQNALRFTERTRDDYLPYEEIPLYDEITGLPNKIYASTFAFHHKTTILIDDVYQETTFDCSGTRDFDARSGYRTVSLLTAPMAPRNGKVIGILQFFNAKDPDTGAIVPFPPDIVVLVEALAAQAAVALDNLQLVEGQKATTENIIHTIAAAVDSKSPHTGHHCVRVPELAVMLAEAACRETEGPLADFKFQTEDEWFEFRVGAWLHDCGKVTTPEYVIEKATKLDSIYNRIHEVRMRFEVLLRDAEIECLKSRLQGMDEQSANERYEHQKNRLLDDFGFIAECNLGRETMDPEHLARIRSIAQKTWQRHFDDKLGLSWEDMNRRRDEPVTPLPAEEFLLSDKPYHVIPRNTQQNPDPALGIKMTIPENLYNYGEIYNLSILRGTLTTEDRYKINEHIIETIKMLEQMTYPDYLKRVPEYATTHHETLNGQGYPRKLSAAELSIPARIMAIADVFEALTSADRPYKGPYKLSKSLKILYEMKKNRQIDPDLFDLFLTSGVYRRFAEQYLDPEQIDEIDVSDFLGPVPSTGRSSS